MAQNVFLGIHGLAKIGEKFELSKHRSVCTRFATIFNYSYEENGKREYAEVLSVLGPEINPKFYVHRSVCTRFASIFNLISEFHNHFSNFHF